MILVRGIENKSIVIMKTIAIEFNKNMTSLDSLPKSSFKSFKIILADNVFSLKVPLCNVNSSFQNSVFAFKKSLSEFFINCQRNFAILTKFLLTFQHEQLASFSSR
jgi:hypothetical protein